MKLQRALLISAIALLLTSDNVNSASSCTTQCAPFTPGAIAYWPLTMESKGADMSGNENHATSVGLDYTYGPNGEPNSAVYFHGNPNSHASITKSPSMDVGKYPGFSVCGFVRFSVDQKDSASLIDWSGDGQNGLYILASSSEHNILLKMSPDKSTTKHSVEFTNMKFTAGSWRFFGVSYDKATGMVTAFMDGWHEQKQIDRNITAGSARSSKVGLGIDLLYPTDFNYNGGMSCMMVFKVVLTADDFERVNKFCSSVTSTQTMLPSITVSDIATTSATVFWTDSPGTFSGYNITIEQKQSKLNQESVHPPFIPSSVSFPKSVLTNLVSGATYRVHVLHMQGNLVGRERSSAWFDTDLPLVVESDSIIFSEITATSAKVSWKEVTHDFDYSDYSVDISPTTGGAKVDPSTVPRGRNTTSLRNLSPGSYYTIIIRARVGLKMTPRSTQSFQTPAAAAAAADTAAANATGSTIAATTAAVISLVVSVIVLIVIIVIVFKFKANNQPKRPNKGNDGYCMLPLKGKNKKVNKVTTSLRNDIKKRYKLDFKQINMLQYRQDRQVDITLFSRNFEMKTGREYVGVTLEDILIDARRESKRYVIEALASDGRTSLMKKLVYEWATDKKLSCFELVFLISTDHFVKFKNETQNSTGNPLGNFVSSNHFFGDKDNLSFIIWDLVKAIPDKVLFIINTNYKSELPEDLYSLLLGNTMRDSTVILTCRMNQVPTVIYDKSNIYTFIRIMKHKPKTIQRDILAYAESIYMTKMGKDLVQKLGIENMADEAIENNVKQSWITTPFMLLVVINVWQDIWEMDTEEEKTDFCLDEPVIYQKVVKNVFKEYECFEGGMETRVNQAAEENTYAQETATLGRLAWDMIMKNISSIPAKELGSVKDGKADVRYIGVLQPIPKTVDGIVKEEYSFIDEIWKFYFAARFLRNEKDKGEMKDKDIQDAVEKVRNLNKNVDELFKKFIELPNN